MRFTLTFLNLLALLSAGVAHASYVQHERRSHIPYGWTHSHKHGSNEVLPLRFGLKQSNMDGIDTMLHDVSDPASPNYGNHWTPAKVAETFAPSRETIDTVRSWLIEAGFDTRRVHVSPTRGWIQLDATVDEAERLLKTEYHVYSHKGGEQHIGK